EPFGEMMSAINVFRVDVQSTDSGADDPVVSDGGTNARARTFFDATFGSFGVRRLLTVNNNTVLATARRAVPEFRMSVVIVNSTVFGGSGGQVAAFSRALSAPETALHEMGHSAFSLADEYEYLRGCNTGETGHDQFPGPEPVEPNVTAN